MIQNSPTPVTDRLYILYTKDHSAYQKVTYSESLITPAVSTRTTTIIPIAEMEDLLKNKAITEPFIKNFLPIETVFWKEATHEMKRATLYSYDFHHRKGNKRIPNVEVANWMEIPYFKAYLDRAFQEANIFNIRKPRTWLNAVISLAGKHRLSVRLGHFHISRDILEGKAVYGAHWDIGLATTSFSIVHHWLYDDMPA